MASKKRYESRGYRETQARKESRKLERERLGLCKQCGGEREDIKYKNCAQCRARISGYSRKYYQRKTGGKPRRCSLCLGVGHYYSTCNLLAR